MLRVGYLFERFPSFGQTFCYREVAELKRQGAELAIFSIRRPKDEPEQDWDSRLVERVRYLPEEAELVAEIDREVRRGDLPARVGGALQKWGRQTDFLRLYQAAYVGARLQAAGIKRVHAHFAGMAARTAFWIRELFGIDFSVTAHANDIFAPRDFVVSLEKIFEAAAAIVTVSDFSARQLAERFPRCAGKIHRVYNGVEVSRFVVTQFDADPPVIISVGRLIEKKGFADLIEACAQLRASGISFRCEIVGEGPLQPVLAQAIQNTRLEAHVSLQGSRSQREIIERLATANVFVLPCTTERDGGMDNLPTVIMEAMAAGLPVISTPLAGVPEMVAAGVTGELVPDRNPAALAAAIEDTLRQPERARQFGRAGRELAQEKFSLETNVRALARILG